MAVYVDKPQHWCGRMQMCHLVADTEAELHAFAAQLGMRREWYQPRSFPHYDICKRKRALAITLGASEITRRKLAQFMRKYKVYNAKAEAERLGV